MTQNPVPSNECRRMNLRVSREAGVIPIPPRRALNSLISLLSLLLLVGCCQLFRGADDVVSFTISPLNMSIQPGDTQKFSATGTLGLGDTKDITSLVKWESSNPARVTIDSTGLATAIAHGTVTISGTYECYTAETSVAVVSQTAAFTTIGRYSTNSEDDRRSHTAFVATAAYSDSVNSVITNSAQCTSRDNTIATVSAVGLATGVSSGKVTITATSGTGSGSTVYDGPPRGGTVSKL